MTCTNSLKFDTISANLCLKSHSQSTWCAFECISSGNEMTGVEDAQREEQQENCMKTIGYRTFSNEDECRGYYRHILTGCRKNQNLNEVGVRYVVLLVLLWYLYIIISCRTIYL